PADAGTLDELFVDAPAVAVFCQVAPGLSQAVEETLFKREDRGQRTEDRRGFGPRLSVTVSRVSDLCPLSSVLSPLSSLFCPESSVFCPLSSVLSPLSSVLSPLTSDPQLLPELNRPPGVLHDLDRLETGQFVEEPAAAGVHELSLTLQLE